MISAQIPDNELKRLQDLQGSGLLDTPHETEFDEIVKFASSICNTPISLISLVDASRQWFKARVGLNISETTREISFCSHAILQDHLFEVNDALQDIRFSDNPLVTHEPAIRFYAGMPLITSSGSRLGTLCVIDNAPGQLTEQQKFGLKVLANNVIKIAELRMKNKELYYLSETQKRIISILAHDVRNPLASIKNIIEFKQSDLLDNDDASQMMNMVTGQLDNTIEMVENIVSWGQAHLQFGTLHADSFDLYALAGQVFISESLNSTVKNNKLINLVVKDSYVYSDKRALEFVLRNLVSNACKFTQNGIITIDMQRDNDKVIVTVADTGVGMTKEKTKALLSNSAFNFSTPGTNNEKGSGLGLLLVREFIDRLGGHISVESELGKGTIFKIII